MKAKVYLETTIVGYLTAWPSQEVVVLAHQRLTREWWANCRGRFALYISELVVMEAGKGDAQAVQERLAVLAMVPHKLEATEEAGTLAERIIQAGVAPRHKAEDALHLALAAINGMDYLLTWNCKHLANAALRPRIEKICRGAGYQPPVICTPEELLEEGDENVP